MFAVGIDHRRVKPRRAERMREGRETPLVDVGRQFGTFQRDAEIRQFGFNQTDGGHDHSLGLRTLEHFSFRLNRNESSKSLFGRVSEPQK